MLSHERLFFSGILVPVDYNRVTFAAAGPLGP